MIAFALELCQRLAGFLAALAVVAAAAGFAACCCFCLCLPEEGGRRSRSSRADNWQRQSPLARKLEMEIIIVIRNIPCCCCCCCCYCWSVITQSYELERLLAAANITVATVGNSIWELLIEPTVSLFNLQITIRLTSKRVAHFLLLRPTSLASHC